MRKMRFEITSTSFMQEEERIARAEWFSGPFIYLVGVPIEPESPERETMFFDMINNPENQFFSFTPFDYFEYLCPHGASLLSNVKDRIQDMSDGDGMNDREVYIKWGQKIVDHIKALPEKNNRCIIFAPGSVFTLNQTAKTIYDSDYPYMGYLDMTSSMEIVFKNACKEYEVDPDLLRMKWTTGTDILNDDTILFNSDTCLVISCLCNSYQRFFRSKCEPGTMLKAVIQKLISRFSLCTEVYYQSPKIGRFLTLEALLTDYKSFVYEHGNIAILL